MTQYLDIRAVPRRSFFEFSRRFATDDREREKLEEFCTLEGQVSSHVYLQSRSLITFFPRKDDLYAYCQRPRRTALEVLADFPSIRIPLDNLFDVFSMIRPRKFSIASYSSAHPGKIQLCVAMVRYKSLVLRTPRVGMCSNWLMNLPLGVYFKRLSSAEILSCKIVLRLTLASRL